MHLKFLRMTISFAGHQRETRPRLGKITTATVLMIQKRCGSAARYKSRHSSAIKSHRRNTSLRHQLQYIIMHGWHDVWQHQNCHALTRPPTSTSGDVCCRCFQGKRRTRWIKPQKGSKATDATTLNKNVHDDAARRSNIDSVCSSGPLRWF